MPDLYALAADLCLRWDAMMAKLPLLRLVRVTALISVTLIAVLSLLPRESLQRSDLGGHLEHVLAYAGTAALLVIGFRRMTPLALLALYAGLLEYAQRFCLGRTSQLDDFLFSLLGILFGAATGLVLAKAIRLAGGASHN